MKPLARGCAVLAAFLLAASSTPTARAGSATGEDFAEPELALPYLETPPVLDGVLSEGEWDRAAAVSLLEVFGPRVPRSEQPVFYLAWGDDALYLAMESLDSSRTSIVATQTRHDHMGLIGNDCVEWMIAPGTADDLQRYDFPTYYIAFNALGTVWDARFVPLLAETHNSWESGIETRSAVHGLHWVAEARVPYRVFAVDAPREGTVWRMNVDRTFAGYSWLAWTAGGGLNDGRVGGNVRFVRDALAVRLRQTHDLVDSGRLKLPLELANPADVARTATVTLTCEGADALGEERTEVGRDERTVTVPAGGVDYLTLGNGQHLRPVNRLVLEVTDEAGATLMKTVRRISIPSPRFAKQPVAKVPMVDVFSRYLPSLGQLAVHVDATALLLQDGAPPVRPSFRVSVAGEGAPALEGGAKVAEDGRQVWRASTAELAEGVYTVRVEVRDGDRVLQEDKATFEKRSFPWREKPAGVGPGVPAPFTPLATEGATVASWGRAYDTASNGLLARITSQGKPILAAPSTLTAAAGGQAVPVEVVTPYAVHERTPERVAGAAVLKAGPVRLRIESETEYDGFVRYRVLLEPEGGPADLDRLTLTVPIRSDRCRFLSAAGDTQGVSILGRAVDPAAPLVYDSAVDTRGVCVSPTFSTLFWVADYDVSFCYAADSDRGWALRDDAPAVTARREGDAVVLNLNLVDRPLRLEEPRVLEFGFQAGPVQPLPEGWRGFQDGGDPSDAPLTVIQVGGSGAGTAGGLCYMHPGDSPELVAKTREKVERVIGGRTNVVVVGYHQWGAVPKGRPETGVFRGEWGIDQRGWESAKALASDWAWQQRAFGDDRDLYIMMHVQPVPSYVDAILAGYEQALRETPLVGTYDDLGYPKPVFDEDLGYGYIREDGRTTYSSGLWIYRERWKRAARVNAELGKPNFTRDSQHVHGHYMPAYGFIGVWAPCERGYYNPFSDRDSLEFYGSMERYVACNPSRQFGQVPMIGLSTANWEASKTDSDTRCIMMLTLLNDQDVGSFGKRDLRTVCRLRHARNRIRPWEPDNVFRGYWAEDNAVEGDGDGILVSVHQRDGLACLLVGNVGDEERSVDLAPDWEALGVAGDPVVLDAEDLRPVEASGGTVRVVVGRHDLRVLLAGAAARLPGRPAARRAPPPAKVLAGPPAWDGNAPSAPWETALHADQASAGVLYGHGYIQGNIYGYAQIRRPWPADASLVQCRLLRRATGSSAYACHGLMLLWDSGAWLKVTPGHASGAFHYVWGPGGDARHERRGTVAANHEPAEGWYPYVANAVRIELQDDRVVFSVSPDGEAWQQDYVLTRDDAYAGPPSLVAVGNGAPGEKPHLENVYAQHFNPRGPMTSFYADFVIGSE